MAQRCFGAKAEGRCRITVASRAADSSQSGRSWPSRSARAMAHRIDRHMLDDPVSRAKDQGVPSAWRAQRISPLGRLELEDEVDGPLDHRPHGLGEAVIAGEEDVVPHAGGDVGADVGVELVLFDAVVDVVLVPGAVGPLQAGQPLVGPLGFGRRPAGGEGHGRLDVVPRIGVTAGEPRDHAARQLPLGDGVDRADSSAAVTTPATSGSMVDLGLAGVHHQALPDQRVGQPIDGPCQSRRSHDVPHQQPVVGLDRRVVVVGDADRALEPPVRRVQGVGVMGGAGAETGVPQLRPQPRLGVDADVAAGDEGSVVLRPTAPSRPARTARRAR